MLTGVSAALMPNARFVHSGTARHCLPNLAHSRNGFAMLRRKEEELVQCVLSADDRDALFAVSPDGALRSLALHVLYKRNHHFDQWSVPAVQSCTCSTVALQHAPFLACMLMIFTCTCNAETALPLFFGKVLDQNSSPHRM